jgi:hypothetical protein
MPTWLFIVIIVAAVIVVVGIAATLTRRKRTESLRERFGPEYDRAIEDRDGRRGAEADLRDRQKRRAELEISPLAEPTRMRFAQEWAVVQQNFVDEPVGAVVSAEGLVHAVMAQRGYPMDDFAAQSDLISVDHPAVVQNYRAAHDVYQRAQTSSATTEDLREAMVRYRSLFDELLQGESGTAAAANDANVR